MASRTTDATALRRRSTSSAQIKARQLPENNAGTLVATPAVICTETASNREGLSRSKEAVTRGVRALVRPRPVFDLGTAVSAALVEHSGGRVTPSLEKIVALLQAGDEQSTTRGGQTKFLRFMLFCDEDCRNALQIDECDIIAYLGKLYEEGRDGPSSVARYISAIDTTLGALGTTPPAERSTFARERILNAMKGYHKRWIGTPGAPRVATPFDAIFEIARAGIRAPDHGVIGVS